MALKEKREARGEREEGEREHLLQACIPLILAQCMLPFIDGICAN